MSLTDLSFLERGREWPPPSEKYRLDQYNANRKLFEGKHDQVFADWIRTLRLESDTALWMVLNWPKRLSTLWADLLVGEPPVFTCGEPVRDETGKKTGEAPEQVRLDRIVADNHFVTTLHEGGIDLSRYGDSVLKLRRKDGKAVVEGQSPSYWFPVVTLGNVREVTHHVIAWTYDKTERTLAHPVHGETVKHLKVEVHEKGKITHRVFRLEASRVDVELDPKRDFPELQGARSGLGVSEETGVNDFLVVHAPGMRTSDRLFGLDDYSDLESIVQEMEVRLAQISRILDKHADPNMYGDAYAVTVDQDTGKTRLQMGGGTYFPVEENGVVPGYLTWDGNLEAAYRELEELKTQFYLVSETSPATFGHTETGQAESGTSLRLRMKAPLAKVGRMRTRLDPVVKHVLDLAAKLEDAAGSDEAPLKDVQIAWNDGLPDDEKEQVEIEAARVAGGFGSKHSAVKRLDGADDEQAQAELNRVATEAQATEPAEPADPKGPIERALETLDANRNGSQGDA